MIEWSLLTQNLDYKRVAIDTIEPGVDVSTVWLGLDHNFWGDGPPLIFETMVFGGEENGATWRWPTKEKAIEGHASVVAALTFCDSLPDP